MRRGVFGGSFDPVHRAHVAFALAARDRLALDRVDFLPAHHARHKAEAPSAPAALRRAMIVAAVEPHPGLGLDDRELRAGEPVPTFRSLEAIAAEHPGDELYLLVGEDSFRGLDDWLEPERIARRCAFVVATRPGYFGERPGTYRDRPVHWLEDFAYDLSSTELRASLAGGGGRDDLPAGVWEIVRANGLYGVAATGEST